jgi:hypothetical protein
VRIRKQKRNKTKEEGKEKWERKRIRRWLHTKGYVVSKTFFRVA